MSHLIEAASSIRQDFICNKRQIWGWEITFRLNGAREAFRNHHEWTPGEGWGAEIKKKLIVIYGLNSSYLNDVLHFIVILYMKLFNMTIVTSVKNRIPPDQIIVK